MRRLLLAVTLSLSAAPAFAALPDFDIICGGGPACQAAFREVSKDITSSLGYKSLSPAEATGVIGFGVGAYGSYTPTQDSQAWENLTGTKVTGIAVSGITVHKGLPFGFDVGASYSVIPSTSARLWGAELRYAVLTGGVGSPALAIRGAYSATTGIDHIKVSTSSIDASISKGFAILTPYVGAGWVRGTVDPDSSTLLDKETINRAKVFAGMRISFVIFELTPEYERIGDNNNYNLRMGFSF
ncbi:hypothetical protein [Stenotrophobium rhamnosiphilum]|uniref:Outer membrane protein beta-barrel domain-containing protein n=1 Tax=Stenotrophobium rhamnosiphilum TaxID=2029166 RepID=A0A2T5MID0_9GAMM|nr:hypothetical protein [Stenotrophobium rhamnosiphilum]PTU32325.1 hypothetical protein CJD38_06655 [Stenotrophobium rhamnosiphilum]